MGWFNLVDGGSTNYSHSLIYADGNDLYVGSDDGKIRKKTGSEAFNLFMILQAMAVWEISSGTIILDFCR